MENRNAELYELIEKKKFIELREILIEMNEVDISEFLETLEIGFFLSLTIGTPIGTPS